MLRHPVRVEVAPQATTVKLVQQKVLFVDERNKIAVLLELLRHEHLRCVLIFTRTKRRANNVAEMLTDQGIRADAIHGNKSQGQRTRALDNFKSGHTRVLVATDIAARGIDVDDISHVINYDLPVDQVDNYVHRIGRTARAGAKGTAYSLCASHERDALREIESLIRDEYRSDVSFIPFQHGKRRCWRCCETTAKTTKRSKKARHESTE